MRQSNPKFINVNAIKSNNQDKLLSHKADCRPSRLSPKCLQTLDALVFGTTLFFWIGGIVSVEEINMNWYNSILSQHYLNNKTFTFYLCPLIMNYRVPKKLLLLVVVFKLDHHQWGNVKCYSNYKNMWDILNCFGAKKGNQNWCVPKKNRFEMDLGSTVLA